LSDNNDLKQFMQKSLDFDLAESGIDSLSNPDEIFDACNEEILRKAFETEDSRLEKKSARTSPRTLGDYFCMWSNTPPCGGLLVVGISKDNIFEGCASLSQNQINEIEKTGQTFCPDAQYSMKRIQIHRDNDGQKDFVVIFLIKYNKTRVIKTTQGSVFLRIGDSKTEIKGDAIRHLQNEKGEISFETERCNLFFPKDFDETAIDSFVHTVKTKKGWDDSHSREEILELMGLGQKERNVFYPNISCALLFSLNPKKVIPGCRIRFLRFSGETEGTGTSWNAVKDEFIDGTIPNLISQAATVIKSQLRVFSKLSADGRFFTSSEYPDFAWYEAVVNACAHRSYGNGMKNMTIFIKMFDDRLLVESPGAFPAFVTPLNIYDMHNPRNPFLMDAMYYLEFVRCAHEGTRRIRDTMRDAQLPPPEFSQYDAESSTVRVTLKNKIKQRKVWVDSDVAEILGAQIAHSLDEAQKRCINFVAENGKINVSDAQRLTQFTWPRARKLLDELVEMKILVRVHRDDLERDPKAIYKLRNS